LAAIEELAVMEVASSTDTKPTIMEVERQSRDVAEVKAVVKN
jgi:hypothetical protein